MRLTGDRKAVLLLEDGKMFTGRAAGKIGVTTGELCFNTGMTGYQEIFTDPSYYGQLLIATNVHIGNYGINKEESQSDSIKISGLICRNFNIQYSRKQADSSIQDFFIRNNLVAISDVDTRALVNHIREKGAMNGLICSEDAELEDMKKMLAEIPSMAGLELATKVTVKEPYILGTVDAPYKVAVLDLGVKKNILNNMLARGCQLKVFPALTPYNEMKAWQPDAYFISNGPGDPAAMSYAVNAVQSILNEGKPMFGICLGHQILALSLGISTYKMHTGHRGLNHPVKNLLTGHSEITSQNHGFGIKAEDVKKKKDVEVTHLNLNDKSVEGIRHKKLKAFSVQYHPEASPGPHDAHYLFDEFVKMMEE
jgi:carbamoyl-phosphate synthase small subunit